MKRLYNHTKKSYDEWEDYDNEDYDWDAAEELEASETYEEDDDTYYTEDSEIVYSDEDGITEYYAEADGGEGYYPEESEEYYAEADNGEAYYPEDSEEYYAEADNGEGYYAEESEDYYAETDNEEGYYAEANNNREAYRAEESEDYYTEADNEEEYYAEESEEYYIEADGSDGAEGYYTEGNEEYYAEEGNAEERYAEEEPNETYSLWYDEKKVKKQAQKPQRDKERNSNVFASLWTKFLEMGAMDRIITATGAAVLILALVTGSVYISNRAIDEQISEFSGVGSQLEGITLIGEKGLLAVADAEIARQAAAQIVEEEEEQKDYDEEEYSNAASVKLNMTSVMKDLKIKFTNKETGKLIGNVPFTVTVTKPDGKSETWSDDDMDGIIYKKNIAAGTYQVLVNELAGEKYKDYTIPTASQSVEVKQDIAYEKIDVSDEVKTEAEVDVAKEDTKIHDTAVESTLQDTVTWVESTSVSETYTEISKSLIPDPATLVTTVVKQKFMAAANVETAVTTIDGENNAEGNAESNPGGNVENNAENTPENNPGDNAEVVTTVNVPFELTLTPSTANMSVGDTLIAQANAAGYPEGSTLTYSAISDNTGVVTAAVDASGNVTVNGLAAGNATITITADYAEGESMPATATLPVIVQEKAQLSLDKTEITVSPGGTATLNATVSNSLTGSSVAAESSDTAVASVAVDGTTITVSGLREGTATITVKYVENNQELQAVCTVNVKNDAVNNRTDKLKDFNGNQLYVLENETYREAFYADYYTAEKFFVKGDVKYTGWQTINGHVYYFTASGEMVTGEQVIQGAKYNFASDGSLITDSGTGIMGIDVSKWNGKIDWSAVKNSGVSYVIIRCGYRGSSEGKLIEDPYFNQNIQGAIDAGLKVGVYFFTQAVDEIEAVEEASYVLDKIKGYKISYPIFLDVEPSGGRGDKIDKATRTADCKTFCETIQRNGYTAGIYANKTWLTEKIDAGSLGAYKIWLAQYSATPSYTGKYDLWQYKATGRVSGISGDVDMNLSYLGY